MSSSKSSSLLFCFEKDFRGEKVGAAPADLKGADFLLKTTLAILFSSS